MMGTGQVEGRGGGGGGWEEKRGDRWNVGEMWRSGERKVEDGGDRWKMGGGEEGRKVRDGEEEWENGGGVGDGKR